MYWCVSNQQIKCASVNCHCIELKIRPMSSFHIIINLRKIFDYSLEFSMAIYQTASTFIFLFDRNTRAVALEVNEWHCPEMDLLNILSDYLPSLSFPIQSSYKTYFFFHYLWRIVEWMIAVRLIIKFQMVWYLCWNFVVKISRFLPRIVWSICRLHLYVSPCPLLSRLLKVKWERKKAKSKKISPSYYKSDNRFQFYFLWL